MNQRHSLPVEVYALVEQTPATVLLEGGKSNYSEADQLPWTRLFTAPFRVCAAYRAAEIPGIFAAIQTAVDAGWCAAGFFSYECGTCFEPLAKTRACREGQPLAWLGIYKRSYAFNHETGRFVDGEPPELTRFGPRQEASGDAAAGREFAADAEPRITAEFSLTESEYARRIAAIHEWIRAGDVYQINFTAPFQVKTSGSVAALYARLRPRQPVDYGAFLHWLPGRHILSFSPELFFRIDHHGLSRRIVTRPMKSVWPGEKKPMAPV